MEDVAEYNQHIIIHIVHVGRGHYDSAYHSLVAHMSVEKVMILMNI